MNYFIQITKCLRFTIFIRGAQAAAHLHHCRGAFFTSYDKAILNGEKFKKPLWTMIFFFLLPVTKRI